MREFESLYGTFLFPDRKSLTVEEVAVRLRFTPTHIKNLIRDGELNAVNISKDVEDSRVRYRIPIESYHEFLGARVVHDQNVSPIFDLPEDVQLDIYRRLRSKFETGEPKA
jgi:excisionase family DNA binding protein